MANDARVEWLLKNFRESGTVTTAVAPDGIDVLVFTDERWVLEVAWGPIMNPRLVVHRPSGTIVADSDYCYEVKLGASDGPGFKGPAQEGRSLVPMTWHVEVDEDGTTLVMAGRVDFGTTGPTDVVVEHRITLSQLEEALQERLSIVHRFGTDAHAIESYRFAFRKLVFNRSHNRWSPDAEKMRIHAVPFRRRRGQRTDFGCDSYTVQDLIPSGFDMKRRVDRGSEGWLLQVGDGGTLVAKYCQEHIEFGVIDTEFIPDRGSSLDNTSHLGGISSEASVSIGQLYLCVGGASPINGAPGHDFRLGPSARFDFGTTLIVCYQGGWEAGYGAYKQLLNHRGHGIAPGYAPSIHWNELYRLSWRVGTNAPLPELQAVLAEAEIARQSGAETFYFDPGWDLFEGSAIWDEARLGRLEDFIRVLRERCGLKVALHLMMHTKGIEPNRLSDYRLNRGGEVEMWEGSYSGAFVCAASPSWQQGKIERLRRLADAGVEFLMFDFLEYRLRQEFRDTSRITDGCWSPDHGHNLPCTLEQHIEGVISVVREVKRSHPDVVIELHDRVSGGLGDYLPLYLDHGPADSFDEHWGFEFMWDPYMDLLSGRALSLYEYNLAYDIPLYLHINNAHDSDTNLSFWWYASTCRHLGIGGLGPESERWPAFVEAVAKYKELKSHFTTGTFVGLDPLSHLHVNARESSAVLLAFNLTSKPVVRVVRIPLVQMAGVDASRTVGGRSYTDGDELKISVEIAALAPAVVTIGLDS